MFEIELHALMRISWKRQPGRATHIKFFNSRNEETSMQTLRVGESTVLTLKAVNDKGEVRPIDGEFVTSASADGIVQLFPEGTNKETIRIVGVAEGKVDIKASADAKPGQGEVIIEGLDSVEVLADLATKITMAFSAPQPV